MFYLLWFVAVAVAGRCVIVNNLHSWWTFLLLVYTLYCYEILFLLNNIYVLYNSIMWWFNLYSVSVAVSFCLTFKMFIAHFLIDWCGIKLDTLVIESFCLHSSLYFHILGTSLLRLRLQFVGGGSKICRTTLTLYL